MPGLPSPHHLTPPTKPDTASYIDFQVQRAGGSEKLFEVATNVLIHDYGGGIPRQINNLATACLLRGMTEKTNRICAAIL